MKKTGSILTVVLLLLFAINIAFAQEKCTVKDSWNFQGILDANNDYVFGTETMVATLHDSIFEIQFNGEYTDLCGDSYSWSLIVSNKYDIVPGKEQYKQSFVCKNVIECDCEPMAFYTIKFQVLINTDNEILIKRLWDAEVALADL